MTQLDDFYWMNKALEQAASVMFVTTPNPRVGCVIVKDQQLLGQGATQKTGGPHAEVCAIRDAQEKAHDLAGSTFYVTLEPCSHYGKTPPCVDAIIAAKPARVVIAMADPNPLVGGRGIAKLQAAGIEVASNLLAEQALAFNPGFISRMTTGRPWVWTKLASSLDGRMALYNGQSQWITSAAARADGHYWRARSCVVLTGLGTVLHDDPLMNVRSIATPRQPVRAIIDSRFVVPEIARIFNGDPVWVFTTHLDEAKAARLQAKNVQVIAMPEKNGHVDLDAVLDWMGGQQINEVHVEAGPGLNGALLQAGLLDELLLYMAPKILGDAHSLFRLPVLNALDQAYQFDFFETQTFAPDLRLRARLQNRWNTLLSSVLHK
ncbi:bifunctional diaminohydroxyphosphoribosylaminopyrimidine deaminase/5-amino-6-(5-phosphoribosylamino)uracil reductase RibD [Advenella sp. RU8]|uniref:bifunctional diaminohydroxyphosphoribosylaminopyrimidine deaminase/5-amino-6-(5-phosphoribosylamino)uracil reductase RibD n=1 Tax=Advenella sp. RU8 TaxID=3399575 RepID=UPI003AAFD138